MTLALSHAGQAAKCNSGTSSRSNARILALGTVAVVILSSLLISSTNSGRSALLHRSLREMTALQYYSSAEYQPEYQFKSVDGTSIGSSGFSFVHSPEEQAAAYMNEELQKLAIINSKVASGSMRERNDIKCIFDLQNVEECLALLLRRVPPPISHRWTFMGDSQMGKIWDLNDKRSQETIYHRFFREPQDFCSMCEARSHNSRCNVHDVFGWERRDPWEWSDTKVEGPLGIGRKTPGCADQSGHGYQLLECHIDEETGSPCPLPVASFLPVEFARDVELQTPQFRTTQENIAHWMTTEHVPKYGRSVCVMGAMYHDIRIGDVDGSEPNEATFISNLREFFRLLEPACAHIIWITPNAPKTEDYPQKTPLVRRWNDLVEGLIRTEFSDVIRSENGVPVPFATIIDHFEASIDGPHEDNAHMTRDYASKVANLLVELMRRKANERKGVIALQAGAAAATAVREDIVQAVS